MKLLSFACTSLFVIILLAITPLAANPKDFYAFNRYKQAKKEDCITLEILKAAMNELRTKQEQNNAEHHNFIENLKGYLLTEEDFKTEQTFKAADTALKLNYRKLKEEYEERLRLARVEEENKIILQRTPNKKAFIESWLDSSSPSREGSQESYGISDHE